MLRRILSIIALLAFLTRSIVGWAATSVGDEHVSISESVPYLQLRDDVQVTLNAGADVAHLGVSGHSQVIVNESARVSHLIVAENAKVVINAGAAIFHIDASSNAVVFISGASIDHVRASGNAVVFISGTTLASMNLLGRSQAYIRHITILGGISAALRILASGGTVTCTADTSIHIHAMNLDFYKGRVTGVWETGEKFAFSMVEGKDTDGERELFHVPQSLPRQVIVHNLIVASFDCSKISTFVEKAICADRELARLDRRLALLYRQALAQSAEKLELQTSQQRWLRTRRNPCKSYACIKKSYENRMQELQHTLPPHIISPIQLITLEKAHAICHEVLKLTNTGQLAQRLMRFSPAPEEENEKWRKLSGMNGLFVTGILDVDYNRDGKKDRLALIEGGGTCGSHDIVDLGAVIKGGSTASTRYLGFSDEEVDSDEDLRWADWGRGDHFLFVQGEPVVVTADFWQKSADVRLVSWFGEGQQWPLCVFAPAGQVQIRVVADRHPRLCKMVAGGRWQPIAWHGTVSPDDIPMLTAAGHHADGGNTALIDINTDGQPDNLALLDYASGAGCGSYRQWLVALSEDGKTVLPSVLNSVLHTLKGPMTRYREPKKWHNIQIFTFEGKPYILGSSPKYVVGVYSVWKDVPQTWCGFEVVEQFKIERLFTPR